MPRFIFIGGKNPGSQTITTPGAGSFIVPYFAEKLRVRGFGAGAGGQGMTSTSGVSTGMTPGGDTTFGALTAGGASSFDGGTASGGDTNTNGNGSSSLFGAGAAAPRTDLGGGAQREIPAGNFTQNGAAGNAYGGGGTSGKFWSGGNPWVGVGGGSGAFVEKVYNVGDLTPGASVSYNVGAGGTGGDGSSADGGNGANGVLIIEWDY